MAKKVKKKVPNPRKLVHKAPVAVASPQPSTHVEDVGNCEHYSRTKEDLDKILVSIRNNLNNYVPCEHCRDEPDIRRASKSKQTKKKGNAKNPVLKKESNFIWVCLDCNRHFCGGEVSDVMPYNHARRHSKQENHMWAVRSDDPFISWCYECNSSIPIEMPAEDTDLDTVKAVNESQSKDEESVALDTTKGYVVRGLSNLGNTCFFNSVMQNLLVLDMLCDYLLKLERSVGPITMAFKKLVVETRSVVDSKGVISPKGLFGAICAKASQFRGYQQQDSHELLRYLLSGLELEEINARKMEKDGSDEGDNGKADNKSVITFVEQIFGGYTSSTVRCSDCGYTSIVQEQFLDLSLPLPSKKTPPKRVPPPPKRRPPPSYRNKASNHKEKVSVNESSKPQTCKEDGTNILLEANIESTVHEQKEDSFNTASEDSEPVVAEKKVEISNTPTGGIESIVPEQKEKTVSLDVDNSSWMDFIEFSSNQHCNVEEVQESDSFAQNGFGPQLENDVSSVNDSQSSFIQDSNISKDADKVAQEISGTASCSQNVQTVENSDTEFEGFGDLFNEPEVTSVPKNEKGASEDFDLFSVSSDCNHDEVDNTHAPVSVCSCLSLFTKPELLTGEQAWICEQCSKNAGLAKNKACRNGKSKSKNPSSKDILGESKEERIEGSTNLSGTSSQYYSCQQENADADNCSVNGFESVECDQGTSGEVSQSIHSDGSEEVESKKYIKVKRDATKRILINRTPPILTIHLKRFRQDARGRFSKLSGYVSFQETLDLRPYTDPRSEDYKKGKCQYRLTGVVEHSGSMSGGHYISYVKGERSRSKSLKCTSTGSSWFYCSDAHIREVSSTEVLNSDAYILFYERVVT